MEQLIEKIKFEKELAERRYTFCVANSDAKAMHVNEGMIHAFSMVEKWYEQVQRGETLPMCKHEHTEHKSRTEFCHSNCADGETIEWDECLDCGSVLNKEINN